MTLTTTNYDLEKKAATFLPVRDIFVLFVAQSSNMEKHPKYNFRTLV